MSDQWEGCEDVHLDCRIAQLEKENARLTAENERLSQLLHDEISQLEIATDLGNKRWIALNQIYEDGEKHNANWCKRKAQEGLGIKNACVVFCPNCEKDVECIHTAELYECKECGEDFAKYIVSRKPANSDVSVTQDVLTDIKTGQSIENTNPDYYKDELYLDEDFRMLAKTYPADVSAIGVTTLIDYVEAVEAELASRINELHYANTVCMEQKHKIARRDELIKRLVEDAKALAIMPYYTNDIRDLGVGGYCRYCHKSQESGHADFCEIVLHRALMQELEKEATDADN